jgi:hypothetical protein
MDTLDELNIYLAQDISKMVLSYFIEFDVLDDKIYYPCYERSIKDMYTAIKYGLEEIRGLLTKPEKVYMECRAGKFETGYLDDICVKYAMLAAVDMDDAKLLCVLISKVGNWRLRDFSQNISDRAWENGCDNVICRLHECKPTVQQIDSYFKYNSGCEVIKMLCSLNSFYVEISLKACVVYNNEKGFVKLSKMVNPRKIRWSVIMHYAALNGNAEIIKICTDNMQ